MTKTDSKSAARTKSNTAVDTRTAGKQERRDRILEIASIVFASEGFANTDVQVIADRANVGKGTIYRHFGNKQKLFLAAARHCVEEMGKFVEAQLGGHDSALALSDQEGISSLLAKIATAFAKYYEVNPHAVEILIQERAEFRGTIFPSHLMYRAQTREDFDQLIERAITTGNIRNLNPRDISDAFSDLLFGSVINGVLAGNRTSLVERVDKAAHIFIHGLIAS